MNLSETRLRQLGRTSRRAAALSGLGAAVMFVSLGLSTLALRDQLRTKRALLEQLDTKHRDLTSSLAQLANQREQAQHELAEIKQKLAIANQQAATAQDDVADLSAALEAPAAATATPPVAVAVAPSPLLSAREQARAEWRAGQAARQNNQLAVAERHFQAAVAADATYAPAYNSLGRLMAAKGDTRAAEKLYRESLVHDPSYRAALYNLATLTEATHGPKAALAPARALLELRPSDARSQGLVEHLADAAAK